MKREFISRNEVEVINPDYGIPEGKSGIAGFNKNIQAAENLQPASTGMGQDESITSSSEEIKQRIIKIQKSPQYKDFNVIKSTDGNPDTLTDCDTQEEIKAEKADMKKPGTSTKCFNNESAETQKKKIRSIEEFYKNTNKVSQTEALLGSIFNELFVNIEIDERPEDEMQNIVESFLTKRPWDVSKHPDYRKQLLYVIKFNLIPGMLRKYFGRIRKNLSDDELQMRNYLGTGLRDMPSEKNTFRREKMPEFEINEEEGRIVFETEGTDRAHRIDRGSYDTGEEATERERKLETGREKLYKAEKTIAESGDYEIITLWEIIKNADDYAKINIMAGKKMNRTPEEIKIIKRRMRRLLK